jgi:hypothetical protein
MRFFKIIILSIGILLTTLKTVNTRLTRGGPMTINEPGYQINFDLASDDRKDLIGRFFNLYLFPGKFITI